eukprot:scaffold10834_cov129-Isochrysis_galbana.AAC.2
MLAAAASSAGHASGVCACPHPLPGLGSPALCSTGGRVAVEGGAAVVCRGRCRASSCAPAQAPPIIQDVRGPPCASRPARTDTG